MGGLIPLLLPSSTSDDRPNMSHAPKPLRRSSCSVPSSMPTSKLAHRRQQSMPSLKPIGKRMSRLVAASPAHPQLTAKEWKQAVDDVKRKYIARKYRSCSTQCCEILDNLREPSAVEPLYLIYLHFYAASSLEWCARPLSSSSNYRTKLLRDARMHYDQAAGIIRVTEERMVRRKRSLSSMSSCSSLRSPELSASSQASVCSSPPSSPRTSIFSLDDDVFPAPLSIKAPSMSKQGGPKPKKKVSFSGLPEFIEFQPEPYIRPDSPTLGWEEGDHLGRNEASDASPHSSSSFPHDAAKSAKPSILRLPEPIVPVGIKNSASPRLTVSDLPSSITELMTEEGTEQVSSDGESSTGSPAENRFDLDAFLQSRSMNRMCATLSALRSQVHWHRDAVDGLLASPDDTPGLPPVVHQSLPAGEPSPPAVGTKFSTPSSAVENQPRNSPQMPDVQPSSCIPAAVSTRTTNTAEAESNLPSSSSAVPSTVTIVCKTKNDGGEANIKERIERLRANGWQRKRFDSRRYEILREQALVELGVCA